MRIRRFSESLAKTVLNAGTGPDEPFGLPFEYFSTSLSTLHFHS